MLIDIVFHFLIFCSKPKYFSKNTSVYNFSIFVAYSFSNYVPSFSSFSFFFISNPSLRCIDKYPIDINKIANNPSIT